MVERIKERRGAPPIMLDLQHISILQVKSERLRLLTQLALFWYSSEYGIQNVADMTPPLRPNDGFADTWSISDMDEPRGTSADALAVRDAPASDETFGAVSFDAGEFSISVGEAEGK